MVKLRCWGDNPYGQLGDGSFINRDRPLRVYVLDYVSAVTLGRRHSCVLLSSDEMQCWGNNSHGQLGDGSRIHSAHPVAVKATTAANLSGIRAIAAGGLHTCALLSSDEVRCWGNNNYGQLGDASFSSSALPVAVQAANGNENLRGVSALASGNQHSCALLGSGEVRCWGSNLSGQLGNADKTSSNQPVAVPGLHEVSAIAAGLLHTCALLGSGEVRCWGSNISGQLGDGSDANSALPVAVQAVDGTENLRGVHAIAAGGFHTCASLSSGDALCWGSNISGQLGDGSYSSKSRPVAVSGLADVSAITAGLHHTCALLADETASCWGDDDLSQLGDGNKRSNRNVPVKVVGLERITQRPEQD